MKKLADIIQQTGIKSLYGDTEKIVRHITASAKEVTEDSLFVAIQGTRFDGHQFINEAIGKGASAIICEKLPRKLFDSVTYIQVNNSRIALGRAAANFYDNPAAHLTAYGVTGTNGKTTVATWIYQLLTLFNEKALLFSTVQNVVNNKVLPASLTTPDPLTLHKYLYQAVQEETDFLAMEVSSHALDQYRIEGILYDVAIFTNLSHDHLDYHKDFKSYRDAKKKLFDRYVKSSSFALINIDDRNAKFMVQNTEAKVFTYGIKNPAFYKAKILEQDLHGISILLENNDRSYEVTYPFIGVYNIYNVLAAIGSLHLTDFPMEELLTHSTLLIPPKGRMEKIPLPNGAIAIIDYAHSPDALKNVLLALRELNGIHRIITVFGAGGNRDKAKRPFMGKVASLYSDLLIITSDNPRDENPNDIAKDIFQGVVSEKKSKTLIQIDRAEAIKTALTFSEAGDIVLIAGKGHENYQEIQGIKYEFNDSELVKKLISE